MVPYCSPAHATAHRAVHEPLCTRFRTALRRRDEVQELMRPPELTDSVPALRAQLRLLTGVAAGVIGAMVDMGTEVSLTRALNFHLLCIRSGVAGRLHGELRIYAAVPAMLLRLGRDQEAYYFIRWFADEGARMGVDAGGPAAEGNDVGATKTEEAGRLEMEEADATELARDVGLLRRGALPLQHLACLLLLKHRVAAGLACGELDAFLMGTHPRVGARSPVIALRGVSVVIETIRSWMPRSAACPSRKVVRKRGGAENVICSLVGEMAEIFKAVDEVNKFFWAGLVDTKVVNGAVASAAGDAGRRAEIEEARAALSDVKDAFAESDGIKDVLLTCMSNKALAPSAFNSADCQLTAKDCAMAKEAIRSLWGTVEAFVPKLHPPPSYEPPRSVEIAMLTADAVWDAAVDATARSIVSAKKTLAPKPTSWFRKGVDGVKRGIDGMSRMFSRVVVRRGKSSLNDGNAEARKTTIT
ncbi:hypothetical protein HK101_008196 [Irineochytrium annulatum]|nr:hypothetical protein HK101_008196 [Irineochytrium annulatum]